MAREAGEVRVKKLDQLLDPDEIRSLKHIAAARGQSVYDFVRSALLREIAGYGCVAVTGKPKITVVDGGRSKQPGRQADVKGSYPSLRTAQRRPA
jgi:hypothetical protein